MYRSPLTEQYQRVMSLVEQLHALPEEERNFILDLMVPLPEPEPEAKKSKRKRVTAKQSHAAAEKARKSPRGQSLSNAIQRTPKVRVDDSDDDDPNEHCQKEFTGGFICNEPADANVHHLRGATGYHEFDAGKSSAPPAHERSSTNGASSATGSDTRNPAQSSTPENHEQASLNASSSTQNSETQPEDAPNVARVANGD